MKLSNFLAKYQVSPIETELAMKVHGDIDKDESQWRLVLKKSVKLNAPQKTKTNNKTEK